MIALKQRVYIYRFLTFCIILFFQSCGQDQGAEPDESIETPEYAKYDLKVGDKDLIGEMVDSQWKRDQGLIFLSTDDKHNRSLYGTLTLNLGPAVGNDGYFGIISALVSHTNGLVGTPQELDGKTYSYTSDPQSTIPGATLKVEASSSKFIVVSDILMDMVEITTGEQVEVSGSFTALSK